MELAQGAQIQNLERWVLFPFTPTTFPCMLESATRVQGT